MMQIIPFSVNHVVSIDMRDHETWASREMLEEFAQEHMRRGGGYSMVDDGKIIACGGVDVVWQGVGEAWTILSRHIEQHKLSLHRTTRCFLDNLIHMRRLHRVQAHVLKADERAVRWINALGFHAEAVLESFGPNREDYILYARLT